MVEALAILAVVLLIATILMLVVLLRRGAAVLSDSPQLAAKLDAFEKGLERSERTVREEIAKGREESANHARLLRGEVTAALRGINESFLKSVDSIAAVQAKQLEAFSGQLSKLIETNQAAATQGRAEMAASLKAFNDSVLKQMSEVAALQRTQLDVFATRLGTLTQSNEQKLDTMRQTVEQKLTALQEDNSKKLEQMRATVDEKLQGTLEKRLGESFKLVSERLEQVHKGLGEMSSLATGVGDLKRVLTNVKTRGTWGEIQLGTLLESILTPEQFGRNIATREGSDDRVEFAIKLPGRDEPGNPLWLPIDAKFPIEDYQRLVEATERADGDGVEAAHRQLELRVKSCARDICDKYISPPATTDFAIMYLPTEGLYAEVVRRTGTTEWIQRECRVIVAGPTTLAALLNSLQMGFRTLAIQKRSSEVWTLLAAVKSEFGKFGDILDGVQKKLHQASNTIEDAAKKSRTIERKLRKVQEVPTDEAERLLLGDADTLEQPVVDLHEGRGGE